MGNIKVSVLVICYNQEKYIKETLDSILNQEHPYTYEVIVCDDASQDSTPQIIKEYASRYKEIVPVLRKKNLGLIKNYHDGASRCRGEYLMGCGGDDYWLPGKIEKQVTFMDTHPETGLCYGDAITINEIGNKTGMLIGEGQINLSRLLISDCVPAGTICSRKSLFNRYVKEIDPITHTWKMEDYPMLLWFAANSRISYIMGECLAYRVLKNSISKFDNTKYKEWLDFRNSVFDVKLFFLNKYPEQCQKIRTTISSMYVFELLIKRTFSYKELKQDINEILFTLPLLKRRIKNTVYIFNNNYILNKVFATSYTLLQSPTLKKVKNLFRRILTK